jgi:hypothetical protein
MPFSVIESLETSGIPPMKGLTRWNSLCKPEPVIQLIHNFRFPHPQELRRVSSDHGKPWHIPGNDRSRKYNRPVMNGDPRHDEHIGEDADIVEDSHGLSLRGKVVVVDIVAKGVNLATVCDRDIVTDGQGISGIQDAAGINCCVVANRQSLVVEQGDPPVYGRFSADPHTDGPQKQRFQTEKGDRIQQEVDEEDEKKTALGPDPKTTLHHVLLKLDVQFRSCSAGRPNP